MAVQAPTKVSYVGEIEVIRWGRDRAKAIVERVEHLAPNATRRLFVAPQALYGNYVIEHGRLSTQYDVHNSEVTDQENPGIENTIAISDNLGLLSANYRPLAGPTEIIAGRKALTLSLINKHTGVRGERLWIDVETKLILAKESYHSNGALASQMRFTEVRYTNQIPAEIFATTVPAGFKHLSGHRYGEPSTDIEPTMKSAGFAPAGPRYLPEGFTILNADIETVKNVRTLHLLYSDGLRSLSLFQNAGNVAADFGTFQPTHVRLENHDAEYVKDGPTVLLSWHERGLSFALVGDLDIRDLLAIAASVVPDNQEAATSAAPKR